ncbi:hypothetical protein [Treponema saccharophilum]|uniref:Uncharacterized protein n=1 Tax=Treponema saccharophilum DSM 2985 TaxID=907348 RepID=H7EKG0_9SPIR|nr:hypothetical protein [Treponema saccharophilum]EIC01865.1 hypothetical protein TresaDRAFT_1617 [Treponema saccharophilum DSM 2985]BDC97532.1 hypothetical protein TRSA_26310 [Treponema saccharophilum]
MDDHDIDLIIDDEDFWQEHEPSEYEAYCEECEAYCEECKEKKNKLINDALHNNLTHLEKCDIDNCFGSEFPTYFEAESIAEVVDYAKNKKIKAMLIFVGGNPQMSEVQEAVDAIKPYCTAECMNGKFLLGCTEEDIEGVARYRMLLALEQQPQADSQEADNEFGEDIPF